MSFTESVQIMPLGSKLALPQGAVVYVVTKQSSPKPSDLGL